MLTKLTTKLVAFSRKVSAYETTLARRSAWLAPMTFGVISENTRIKKVTSIVATPSAHSSSPNSSIVITLTSIAAAALIRLLNSRMTPSRRSVLASRSSASAAPFEPFAASERKR